MFRNYLLTALRHLSRHKLFTLINVFCLSIGIVFSLAIIIYVNQQRSVNSQLRHIKNQYLLKVNWKSGVTSLDFVTFGPLAKVLREEYPGLVAGYYRYNPVTNTVSANNRYFKENIAIGDTTLVSLYDFDVLYGDKQRAFTDFRSAVITESMAMKLFDRKEVINEVISVHTTVNNVKQDYRITAVLKDYPFNSVTGLLSETYSVFVPTQDNQYYGIGDPAANWNGPNTISLVELQPGATIAALQKPLQQVITKYLPAGAEKQLSFELAPLADYHLLADNGKVQKLLSTLMLVAVFIMGMAVINFININTGASAYRAREIGVRKVLGGSKGAIMLQYLSEALLLTLLSGLVALVLYEGLYKVICQVLHTVLPHCWQLQRGQVAQLLLLLLAVGLIAGAYPAFVISRVNTVLSVKGHTGSVKGGLLLRKGFLAVQFTLAIAIVICTITINRQVDYIFSKNLGYSKDQVLVIYALPKQWDTAGLIKMAGIKRALQANPAVKSASLCFEIPDRYPPNNIALSTANNSTSEQVVVGAVGADEGYAATFGLQLTAGQFFKPEGSAHVPGQLVLNQAAVKALKLKDPVGKSLYMSGTAFTVEGVVKDFNYSNLSDKIGPLVFMHVNDNKAYRFLTVKLATSHTAAALEAIKTSWKQASPQSPFEYFFMEDKFASLYQAEMQLKASSRLATLLNMVIVLLGIFGIVTFAIVKRAREVAVRRVLGAPSLGLVLLFVKEYIGLFIIANLVAWPLAYYFCHQWLGQYAYRVQLSVYSFGVAALGTFIGAALLITLQCLRIVKANPSQTLRTE